MSSTVNRIQPGDGDPRHGSYNGYSNHRCRCSDCAAANSAYVMGARLKRKRQGLADYDPRHGKATTYSNYGCRCRACTDAWSAASKTQPSYRARRAKS